ncbi:MAG TPA: acetate kinase [Candidatus Omnitrophota bacterium]|nr:acetate kinase [Candidatus Omnitrophota bacterium]HNQ50240.1 acetate kinase [Candidatus Omnitrophota bacterium]HQO37234.1 acetate kinase [Candidatus Omnitrophota bacterium]HQQ05371.1 acetate kinase [Candidatus Omnitrophota bacterium]
MKILILNSGSSSIKYQLFEMPEGTVIARGLLEKIGEETSIFSQKSAHGGLELKKAVPDHDEGVNFIIGMLTDPQHGVISSVSEISGIGHRVVHGGEEFTASVIISDDVIEKIKKYADLAPLHNPPNLMGIMACRKLLPSALQVACFDTAFHHSIPAHAYLYAIPYGLYKKFGIRRYGFHGTSHLYVAKRLAALLNTEKEKLNIITCHLGNGCSITAVEKGMSVDTSMGFTPLEGLVMGTRSGDIDPAILFYLNGKGYSCEELNNLLNKKSGLLGISELSNDMRNLVEAKMRGDMRAQIAIDIFCYRIRKYIGSYMAVLGTTDAIVFTGGIGENNAMIRAESLRGMQALGVELDAGRNESVQRSEARISTDSSRVKVYVIPTNEELQIAYDTYAISQRIVGSAPINRR